MNATLSADEVREGFAASQTGVASRLQMHREDFDRWLESVRAEERERIARNIEAKTPDGRYSAAFCAGMDRAVRIVREGA